MVVNSIDNRHRHVRDGPRDAWPVVASVWSVDGKDFVGHIKYNAARKVLSAHCLWRRVGQKDRDLPSGPLWGSHGVCRLDRGCGEGLASEHKGRPVAMMIAWLQKGCDCQDRPAHFKAVKRLSRTQRLKVRSWAENLPSQYGELLKLERPLRPGEPKEHDRCP